MSENQMKYFVYELGNLGWTLRQLDRNDTEATLLATIRDNSQLPKKEQQRYQQLWRKCEDETLSQDELVEYQSLLSQLEARNLKRIKALIALVKIREKALGEITTELDLSEKNNAITSTQKTRKRS